jgi:hypothetical protein
MIINKNIDQQEMPLMLELKVIVKRNIAANIDHQVILLMLEL